MAFGFMSRVWGAENRIKLFYERSERNRDARWRNEQLPVKRTMKNLVFYGLTVSAVSLFYAASVNRNHSFPSVSKYRSCDVHTLCCNSEYTLQSWDQLPLTIEVPVINTIPLQNFPKHFYQLSMQCVTRNCSASYQPLSACGGMTGSCSGSPRRSETAGAHLDSLLLPF